MFPFNRKSNDLIRTISSFITVFFCVNQLAYAAPSAAPMPAQAAQAATLAAAIQDPALLDIPLDHVMLKEFHRGTNGKLVIHIQDAHSNFSGQLNLAGALEKLMNRYDVSLVLSEGSAKDSTLTDLKKIADQETWNIAARRFLMDGVINGEEYLNLTTTHPMTIRGVEYRSLYDDCLKAYAELVDVRKNILLYLHRVKISIQRLKNKLYTEVILGYEKVLREEEKEEGGLARSIGTLLDLAGRARIVLEDRYPEVLRLKAVRGFESAIDFEKVNAEQAELFSAISAHGASEELKTLMKAAKDQKNMQVSQFALLNQIVDLAERNNVDVRRFKTLAAYRAYLESFTALRMDRLLEELEALEDEVYKELLPQEDARRLRTVDRYTGLLEKAYRIQMSSDDFRMYVANEPEFHTIAWEAFLNEQLRSFGYLEDLLVYRPYFEKAAPALKNFYDLVDKRDNAFLENAGRIMKEEGQEAAFLVAGGYHTEHLTQLFREEGTSYVVLTPIVSSETDHEKYEEILLQPLAYKPERHNTKLALRTVDAKKIYSTLRAGLLTELGVAEARLPRYESAPIGLRISIPELVLAASRLSKQGDVNDDSREASKATVDGQRSAEALDKIVAHLKSARSSVKDAAALIGSSSLVALQDRLDTELESGIQWHADDRAVLLLLVRMGDRIVRNEIIRIKNLKTVGKAFPQLELIDARMQTGLNMLNSALEAFAGAQNIAGTDLFGENVELSAGNLDEEIERLYESYAQMSAQDTLLDESAIKVAIITAPDFGSGLVEEMLDTIDFAGELQAQFDLSPEMVQAMTLKKDSLQTTLVETTQAVISNAATAYLAEITPLRGRVSDEHKERLRVLGSELLQIRGDAEKITSADDVLAETMTADLIRIDEEIDAIKQTIQDSAGSRAAELTLGDAHAKLRRMARQSAENNPLRQRLRKLILATVDYLAGELPEKPEMQMDAIQLLFERYSDHVTAQQRDTFRAILREDLSMPHGRLPHDVDPLRRRIVQRALLLRKQDLTEMVDQVFPEETTDVQDRRENYLDLITKLFEDVPERRLRRTTASRMAMEVLNAKLAPLRFIARLLADGGMKIAGVKTDIQRLVAEHKISTIEAAYLRELSLTDWQLKRYMSFRAEHVEGPVFKMQMLNADAGDAIISFVDGHHQIPTPFHGILEAATQANVLPVMPEKPMTPRLLAQLRARLLQKYMEDIAPYGDANVTITEAEAVVRHPNVAGRPQSLVTTEFSALARGVQALERINGESTIPQLIAAVANEEELRLASRFIAQYIALRSYAAIPIPGKRTVSSDTEDGITGTRFAPIRFIIDAFRKLCFISAGIY